MPTLSKNKECLKHSVLFKNGLNMGELWALEMFDSSAKLSSGILNGNLNQYGDFDQCLSIKKEFNDSEPVYGKYCLVNIDLHVPLTNKLTTQIDSLIHSHYLIRSNIKDHGHRVPKFSSFNWGVCIPSSCHAEDLQNEMYRKLEIFTNKFNFSIHVDNSMCSSNSLTKIDNPKFALSGHTFASIFFQVLFFLTVFGTIWEFKSYGLETGKLHRLLKCFAIQKNIGILTNLQSRDEIKGLHGLRCLNAIALLLVHKSMALLYNPYINRTEMAEHFGRPWTVIGRTAILYTDSFIYLSGLLTANAFFVELASSGNLFFIKRLRARFIRIFPNMLALILFCTYYLPNVNSGPLWPQVITKHSELCKENMWRNFLFIHNYFGFEKMCLTHTHQIGMDMQLFLICPIFVFILWHRKVRGLYVMGLVALLSTILRGWAAYHYNLGSVVYYGIRVQQLFDTANYSYILPTHRLTIYIFGILMAYIINKKITVQLSQYQVRLFWFIGIILAFGIVLGPFPLATKGYQYNALHSLLFNAFSPIIWGIFMIWGTYAVNYNYSGWFENFINWYGFKLFTKIAYSFYLVQFPVFFYNIGRRRHAETFNTFLLIEPMEVVCILFLSTLLAILVEIPFINVHDLWFSKGLKIKKSPEYNNNNNIYEKNGKHL